MYVLKDLSPFYTMLKKNEKKSWFLPAGSSQLACSNGLLVQEKTLTAGILTKLNLKKNAEEIKPD